MDRATQEKIYAGVLGKILGVYHGRPVEGWSYEKIRDTFGEVDYFVNGKLSLPIMLPDDDISGTFAFFRALEDHGYPKTLTPHQVGQTWLNYIIEEKTILWWGGLGRSTEHTAFLNLKNGIDAPQSGSHAQNGPWIPAQIGAQIFMDAFALAAPNDPDRAAQMVRAAASVSHDGIALDAAVLLGTMEAMAFSEQNVDRLLDAGLRYVSDRHLLNVVDQIRAECAKTDDWHKVRAWIAGHHGYDHYDGPCHMIPNHAIVLMALLMAGDDFGRSLMIATSAGWDTDCNAGNVGCLNGVRLGLAALDKGPDLRRPVSDFLYVVTSDGASSISDAVRETRGIVAAADVLAGRELPPACPRFGFDYPGSTQGFAPCPRHVGRQGVLLLSNPEGALTVQLQGLSRGVTGTLSTPVFVEPFAATSSFAMVASPTLYPGQTATARITAPAGVKARLYALYYAAGDDIARLDGDWIALGDADMAVSWTVPQTNGLPLYRLGVEFGSDSRFDGEATIHSVDWSGAPETYEIKGMLMPSIWNLAPFWIRAFVSSARHFAPDFKYTLCVSHPFDNGLVTTGSRDWDNYSVASSIDYSINDGGGLIARSRGHRRYYAGMLKGNEACIVRRYDDEVEVLARAPVASGAVGKRDLMFSLNGDDLHLSVDGVECCAARDDRFQSGAAGFIVEKGTIVADGFLVRAIHRKGASAS
ncbi:ADP-ribosylglycohydrolase family protein [Mesorhizobium sp. BR1-1-16]|uniref:ADP-ribosylglycohydrolase family protein n=1 Tax=Mesorhizobium sp. BR1-1-16 TaxID=2876653 RepID=UPI001CCC22CD|nr:ADP-ribosylglycohydrolase family protein [Mesorhizobium sp. BR1-1-16]MBZ9938567.1 ADP-ribosylglycohydrolase family protein [Mesorhizobium sp. BR1-1-16]